MSGHRALKRALALNPDQATARLVGVPQIVDTTELITPEIAQEMLRRNSHNREINWRQVDRYARMMEAGDWPLIAQPIIIDTQNNILSGQQRLWAVVRSGVSVYMRVSRGNLASTARYLDRGRPQNARDLATRETSRRHSPIEASLARAIYALNGTLKPSTDEIADLIIANADRATEALKATQGTKKTRAILMVMAAVCRLDHETRRIACYAHVEALADRLTQALRPATAEQAWGRGALFGLAMSHAKRITDEQAH